jgi:glycosyl hydrolase family 28
MTRGRRSISAEDLESVVMRVLFAAVPLVLAVATRVYAQDTRQVSEPRFPAPCATLDARLSASSGALPADAERQLDAARIQQAIDSCAAGHAVELRTAGSANAFLSGPLELRAGVTLRVMQGVTLFASRDPRLYDVTPGSCGVVTAANGRGCKPLIRVANARDAAVMGEGTIDGRGGAKLLGQDVSWWDLAQQAKVKNEHQQCPRIVVAEGSDNFTLYRVTLRNSPNFHVSYSRGNGFTAWAVIIDAPKTSRNTDGIDPSSATNVTITNSLIRAGDDNVAIKAGDAGPASHITIAHNHFYSGHGMSIGSETNGGVHAVRVTDLSIDGADNGIRIKSNSSRGGLVHDVVYEDVCIRGTKNLILLDTAYPFSGATARDKVPVFSGITLRHVRLDGGGKIQLQPYDASHPLGVTFDDVTLDAGAQAVRCAAKFVPFPAAIPVAQQHEQEHAQPSTKLGTVRFANSCSASAQPALARAIALLHSFEFSSARAAFEEVLKNDSSCGIALWGIALTHWSNPFAPGIRPASQLQPGRAALDRARTFAGGTPRERGLIAAAANLFDDAEKVDQRTRVAAYRTAMERLSASYPDDSEIAIFYALALAAAADPADKTYADALKAGAILEKLFAQQPDHPGLAHYIIHSYDYPALASHAVDAARRYSAIAPDAPHALHMPSHTFTRLGYWQESIDTNILSAAAARRANSVGEELHASDYEVYAYLQTAQDAAAKRIVDALPDMIRRYGSNSVGGAAPPAAAWFASTAIPARYALERGAWRDAAALEVRGTPTPYADATTWFARAVGAARAHDPALLHAAQKNVDALSAIAERLAQAHEDYWSEQVAIERLGASAWLALAHGDADSALRLMREAADREDRTEKSAVTPGPLAPAREMLGEMLLELKQPKAALAEFTKTIAKEPGRYRALAGGAAAAEAVGNANLAKTYYRRLLATCERADTPLRPELIRANRALR